MDCFETKIEDNVLYIYNITPENSDLSFIEKMNNITSLYIKGEYLDHFTIPKNIKDLHIDYLGLKSIIIPDGIKNVYCSRNFLRTIEIPSSLQTLVANKNLLHEITFRSKHNNQLEFLDIRSNKMTKLDFEIPESMDYFNASMNNIMYIAPKIKNYLSLQYIQAESSSSSSEDENWFYSYSSSI